MSLKIAGTVDMPYLLPGKIVSLPGRGEMFVRYHEHRDPSRATLLLLHGWTASSDMQFFMSYEALAQDFSIIGVDHRGHGRGMRPNRTFSLEDCAQDAAHVVRALGIKSVVTVGYSMGGPISLLFWKQHPELVDAMVFQATALEWNGTRKERAWWKVGRALGPVIRRLTTPRALKLSLRRAIPRGHEFSRYIPWMVGEMRRNDPLMVSEVGQALAKFDATPFARNIKVPTSLVLTTQDRLVPPVKQEALAQAVGAQVVELDGDHFVPLQAPREFTAATRRAIDLVICQL